MAHPYHHARSSAKQFGGIPEDFQAIHDWFDKSKAHRGDPLHRALRHHSEGIFTCEEVFGTTITLSTCKGCGKTENEHFEFGDENLHVFEAKVVPVRLIGEQHVLEDLGRIPTANEWLEKIPLEPWMTRSRKLSRELDREEAVPASQS